MNDKLKNLEEEIRLIMSDPCFNGLAIVVVSIDTTQEDRTLTFGNMCVICAADILIDHIEENGIEHSVNDISSKKIMH